MTHPLDGARLKVIRAQEHLDSLKSEIWMYLKTHTHEIVSQPTKHLHPGLSDYHVLSVVNPDAPPIRLSTLIGDCVTNARAALDYIAWELAQHYFVPPINLKIRGDKKISSFPLFVSPNNAALTAHLNALANRQVPTGAINEIGAVQPSNAGYESLWWLHELVNEDKHRMPLLTIGEFDNFSVRIGVSPIFQDLVNRPIAIPIVHEFATEGGSSFQSNVQMKAEFSVYVTWQNLSMPREPVDRTLEQIIECVAHVIPRFDPFFV